jgi:SAM-dependent MidA family methyltransferase
VQWVDALPEAIEGVVLGNEVLDAMPVKLLMRRQGVWHERGVRLGTLTGAAQAAALPLFAWQDRITPLRPPLEIEGEHDYLTEIHPQAESFMRTLAERLTAGAAFFIDYGFPEHEYYHPQRHMGTVMCHQAHLADADPLARVGQKDITAHVNFTGIALAAQDAGLEVLGYCSQARFLLNCGLAEHMQASDLTQRVQAQRLVMEHEMGELFKVIGLCRGEPWAARGFAQGDRTHTL